MGYGLNMANTDNLESLIHQFEEVKGLVEDVKTGMMTEEDCNNQFYNVLQTLDGLVTTVGEMSNEKEKPTDEYTILQTNILEVKRELAGLSQNIDEIYNGSLKELMAKLTEKVNRLEILTNNAGIDQAVVANLTNQIEKNLSITLKDTTDTLYSQGIASTDSVKKDIEEVNSNMRECVEYLEKSLHAVSDEAVQHLSDDMTILGTTVEKTTDNLRRSIIDIFTRIQETVQGGAIDDSQGQHIDTSAFDETFEMLKNGIYNLNVKTEQRISKLNRLIEEMDIFTKLQNFAKLKDLPALGDLKHTLNANINRIVEEYSYTLQTSQDRDELASLTQQFRKDVYNAIISMLGHVSEFLLDEDAIMPATTNSAEKPTSISEKLEELTAVTELNNAGYDNIQNSIKEISEQISEYSKRASTKRASVEEYINEIRNNITEIQVKTDTIKKQNAEINDVVRECTNSIIETSTPDRNLIKDMLKDIKKNISILQSGDEESDYTYSMQDIESDVAKIRIYLNELSQNGVTVNSDEFTEELDGVILMVDSMKQQLNKLDECDLSDTLSKLKDDVTSISTRVNKLLLTSDNSYNMIESSLKEFKVLSEEIDVQIKELTSTNKFKSLEEGLSAVKTALTESNNYNSVINQSLIMLAEWVDNAGEMITNIAEKQSKLDSIDDLKILIKDLKTTLSASSDSVVESVKDMIEDTNTFVKNIEIVDYSEAFNTLSAKLIEQDDVLAKQEEKLAKLDEKLTTVLELVAKNDSSVLDSKMREIDAKMEKLNSSIDKLTSFINEE